MSQTTPPDTATVTMTIVPVPAAEVAPAYVLATFRTFAGALNRAKKENAALVRDGMAPGTAGYDGYVIVASVEETSVAEYDVTFRYYAA